MKVTEPIRDRELLNVMIEDQVQKVLVDRDMKAMLFLVLLYLTRRVSDSLSLKKSDIKDVLSITEAKTGLKTEQPIDDEIYPILEYYLETKGIDDFLFPSRKYMYKGGKKCIVPIGRKRAWEIIHDIGIEYGIQGLAPHSLRKTKGYWMREDGVDPTVIQKMYNHSTLAQTDVYTRISFEKYYNTTKKYSLIGKKAKKKRF